MKSFIYEHKTFPFQFRMHNLQNHKLTTTEKRPLGQCVRLVYNFRETKC